MSNLIWHALTPEEQNQLVAATLFGWQPVPCPEQGKSWDEADLDWYKSARKWYCTRCKVSCEDVEAWERVTHHPTNPCRNYTTDWNAAMEVLRVMAQRYHPDQRTVDPMYETFTNALLEDAHGTWGDVLGLEMPSIVATWTPERLCLAALRAYGVEMVEEEEEKHGTQS